MKTLYATKGLELTGELAKYASGKTARLARKVPRRFRSSAICKVAFAQSTQKGNKSSTCDVVLTLNGTTLEAKETTQHVYAALDIAAVHIEEQLKAYARIHRRRLLRRSRSAE